MYADALHRLHPWSLPESTLEIMSRSHCLSAHKTKEPVTLRKSKLALWSRFFSSKGFHGFFRANIKYRLNDDCGEWSSLISLIFFRLFCCRFFVSFLWAAVREFFRPSYRLESNRYNIRRNLIRSPLWLCTNAWSRTVLFFDTERIALCCRSSSFNVREHTCRLSILKISYFEFAMTQL
jgi:hypothetical protein